MPYGSKAEAYKNAATLAYLTADAVLAAWMRLKYPHLTVGALVSSAPILQFEDIVPLDTFYNIVSNDFKVSLLLVVSFHF
ncbi:Lysosomal Pro-X carboxypeptidase [Linum perenne]